MINKASELALIAPENMSIYEAAPLKDLFKDTLENFENIEVNLANVAEIDCSGLQLMVALKNDALRLNKTLNFTHHSNEVIEFLDLFNITSFFGDPVIIGK